MTRTRIAPSPTGYPHIGTIYQALFNYAFAHGHEGKFLVRIEDTDRSRFVQGAEDVIFTSLDWAGLTEDESPRRDGGFGPYRQSERLSIYHRYVQELIDKDHAYFAYYKKSEAGKKSYSSGRNSAESAQYMTPPEPPPPSVLAMPENGDWIVRMRVPKDGGITFRDEIRGDITFSHDQVTEQVLLKSDKFPTYHLAVVVDDHLMGITHIVRGEEWISSTPKHVLLYDYFGWEKPKFYHTPDLRNPDKSKLSKRHGHTDVRWYQSEGYLPEAILNFLALQGWSHPEEKEIFSLDEFTQLFDLKDLKPVGPVFDLTKLGWMNGVYIRERVSEEELKNRLLEFDPVLREIDGLLFEALLPIVKTRIKTMKEFSEQVLPFLRPAKQIVPPDVSDIIAKMKLDLRSVGQWESETIKNVIIDDYIVGKKIKLKDLYKALVGTERGLPLADMFAAMGKKRTLSLFDTV